MVKNNKNKNNNNNSSNSLVFGRWSQTKTAGLEKHNLVQLNNLSSYLLIKFENVGLHFCNFDNLAMSQSCQNTFCNY